MWCIYIYLFTHSSTFKWKGLGSEKGNENWKLTFARYLDELFADLLFKEGNNVFIMRRSSSLYLFMTSSRNLGLDSVIMCQRGVIEEVCDVTKILTAKRKN